MTTASPTVTVSSLRPGDSGKTLLVKVIDVNEVLNKPKTATQGPLRIAEATIGDASGVITLSARNQFVDSLVAGKYLLLENARIDMFKGTMRVQLDRNGSAKEAEGTFKPNTAINMSKIEFDVIPVPAVEGKEGGKEAEAAKV